MTGQGIIRLARQIERDISEHKSFEPVLNGNLDLEYAYQVQDAVVDLLIGENGDKRIGGYKLAFNNPAAFEHYGLTEPCRAPVLANRIVDSGQDLQRSAFRQLAIEPEIAVIIGQTLPATATTTSEDVRNAIDYAVAAIELLDVRNAFDIAPTAAEAVAQGVYNAGVVIGDTRLSFEMLDLETLPVSLHLDTQPPVSAVGAAPQNPIDAVCWLANHLGRRGACLEKGMIVLCGTHLPVRFVDAAKSVRVQMGPLGEVSFQLS